MEDNKKYVRLDLVGYIKDLLKEFKASFFDILPDEIDDIIKKYERGEELTLEELGSLAAHKVDCEFKINYKDGILSHDSFIFSDDKKELITEITEEYSELGIYLLYESYYVMKFLDEAPSIITRALNLRQIFISRHPSQRVKEFCKEAYLTYINGNFIASVVLLRSIIETLLHEKLGIERSELWKLNDLAKERGVYGIGTWRKVDIIRDKARKIVHNIYKQSLSEDENKKLIILTQDVLSHLLN